MIEPDTVLKSESRLDRCVKINEVNISGINGLGLMHTQRIIINMDWLCQTA